MTTKAVPPLPGPPRTRASDHAPTAATRDRKKAPMMPLRDDSRNDTTARCPACGQPFTRTGRRRWCSDACRQKAWRSRHLAEPAAAVAESLPAVRPHRDHTVYECGDCGQRFIGQQRCDDCGTFCRRLGPGGTCPACDEPVTIADLIPTAIPITDVAARPRNT